MDAIGGRKVIVSALVLIIGVVVTFLKGDIPTNLLQLLEVVGAGYILGNVGVKVFGKNFGPGEPEVKQDIVVHLPESPSDSSTPSGAILEVPPTDLGVQAIKNRQAAMEEKVKTIEESVQKIAQIIVEAQQNAAKQRAI